MTKPDETQTQQPPDETGDGDGAVDGGDGTTDGTKTVPYSRFKEVIDERNDLQESLEDLQGRLEEIEGRMADEKKPLEEKVTELSTKLDELQQERDSERRARQRLEVATEVGIPADLAPRLRGETPEELKADAETLKGFLRETSPGVPPSGEGASGTPKRFDLKNMTPAEVRENKEEILRQARTGEQ